MTLTKIHFHALAPFNLPNQEHVQKWMEQAIKAEKKQIGEINCIFCDDEYLLEKNKTYLNHNTLTDIITFDYTEKDVIIGDLFISTERVHENAKIYNVTFELELSRVLIHGVLHLLGYSDKTEEEKKTMRNKENFYLKKL
jgi:rRNA maturation RNase YbeY